MNINWLIIPTLFIALLLFVIGEKSIKKCRARGSRVVLSAFWFFFGTPGFLMVLYYLHWFDNATWFYEFRSFPLIELSASATGLFAGALAELMKGSILFPKPVFISVLFLGIAAPYLKPVLAPLPKEQFADRWRDDVCLQSTPSSCGAASAATIFRVYGINLREMEIAEECFTYHGGTENWYIARAFRKRGFTVNYRIENDFPLDLKVPVIAGVRVGNFGHFIAIVEESNGKYITGDPLKGRQEIPIQTIEKEFNFTGFFMEINQLIQ